MAIWVVPRDKGKLVPKGCACHIYFQEEGKNT